MAKRQLRTFDDPMLRKECKKVSRMTDRLRTLIDDMFDTMYEAEGVGLAAPQVGIMKQICVIDCGGETPEPYVLINPEITLKEGEQTDYEGCLSVPGYRGMVTRAEHIKVEYLDENMQACVLEADGLLSRCIQHETDHFHGIMYTDIVEGELEEAVAEEEEAGE